MTHIGRVPLLIQCFFFEPADHPKDFWIEIFESEWLGFGTAPEGGRFFEDGDSLQNVSKCKVNGLGPRPKELYVAFQNRHYSPRSSQVFASAFQAMILESPHSHRTGRGVWGLRLLLQGGTELVHLVRSHREPASPSFFWEFEQTHDYLRSSPAEGVCIQNINFTKVFKCS